MSPTGGGIALLLALGALPAAGGLPSRSWDRAVARLQAAGGARVDAVQVTLDPGGGRRDSTRLAILLGAGGSLRIDYAGRRQVVAMRPDGGEILDHRHRQLVRLGPEQARLVAGVWRLFLDPGGGLEERALGSGRSVAALPGGAGEPDSVSITLGREGLPSRLELGQSPTVRLDLVRWRFVRAPAPARFRLAAPPGYEVVDWP